jgi:hypothetical protein|tara:strand:+ start:239 stop:469 length:231 start_codon:yes stop_codon:yes gene_type:complete
MFDGAGTWFYVHCVLALVLIVTDANGTLEPTVNNFEKRIGIYQEPTEEEEDIESSYFIEEEPIDSSFILPDNLKRS